MRFKPVDRLPFTEIGLWEQTIDRWHDEGWPRDIRMDSFWLQYDQGECFGLDRFGYIDITMGMIPGFQEEILEEDERYMIIRRTDGRITKALKKGSARGMRSSMDTYLEFPVKCRADWEDLQWRYDPNSQARYPPYWDDHVRCLEGRGYPIHIPVLSSTAGSGFYSSFRNWMGTEMACTIFYDDPMWAHEMCDFIAETIIATCRRALEDVEVDFFFWHEDFAYNAGPLVSPRIFKEFLLPRYRRVNDFVRAHGVDIIFLDTDGDPRALIPLLLEAGVNGLFPCECAAHQDPVALRDEYGQGLLLWGGIDKRALAQDRKAIKQELLRKLPPLIEDGGYVPTVDHVVPPDVSYDNFLFYLDLKRRILEGNFGG